ncbi:unnamed protein product, partial [Porites lobata]
KEKGVANFDFDFTILNANFLYVRLDKDNVSLSNPAERGEDYKGNPKPEHEWPSENSWKRQVILFFCPSEIVKYAQGPSFVSLHYGGFPSW